jgi:hypothetical protein
MINWKEDRGQIEIIAQDLPGRNEENHRKLQSG